MKETTLQNGEGVIHKNDYQYLTACENGLKQAIKTLNEIAKGVDGTGTGTMAFECVDGIKTMLDRADPMRDTSEASFVKKIESNE